MFLRFPLGGRLPSPTLPSKHQTRHVFRREWHRRGNCQGERCGEGVGVPGGADGRGRELLLRFHAEFTAMTLAFATRS